jgi:type I site-specific restriction endonuclease
VETLASALIRAMYEYLKHREEELKFLRETEKALLDQDPAWQSALAELEPLPLALHADASPPREIAPQNGHLETLAEESEEVDQTDGPISAVQPALPPDDVDTDFKEAVQSVTIQFMDVRTATEGIIASLGAISEHAQISKATNTDASRKLKSIDSALTRLRSEAESVERSQAYIRAWEAEEAQEANSGGSTAPKQSALPGLSAVPRKRKTSSHSTRSTSSSTASNSGTGRFSERVRSEMKAAISLLETSHERARVLLSAASG